MGFTTLKPPWLLCKQHFGKQRLKEHLQPSPSYHTTHPDLPQHPCTGGPGTFRGGRREDSTPVPLVLSVLVFSLAGHKQLVCFIFTAFILLPDAIPEGT